MAENILENTIIDIVESIVGIKSAWIKFQMGKISKEDFEKKYKKHLLDMKEYAESEIDSPNNGLSFSYTNPDVEYFVKNKY